MRQVNRYAAGVDIGAQESMACVPDGDAPPSGCAPLEPLPLIWTPWRTWFVARGIQTAAMESTGGYWIPLFETLEARGMQCWLISAQAIKYWPGQKSDVLDCQWMQTLHHPRHGGG